MRRYIWPALLGEFGDDAHYSGHVEVVLLCRGIFERRAVAIHADD